MLTWTLFIQILIVLLILILLLTKSGRRTLTESASKLLQISTSKRFITLMIATWFVYQNIKIDPNWLLLAGFYIGLDTVNNNGVFSAFADYLKNKPRVKDDG